MRDNDLQDDGKIDLKIRTLAQAAMTKGFPVKQESRWR